MSEESLEEDAKATLENLGLIVTVETGTSSSVGEGEVYEQSISSGTRVNSGTEITISVNRADATNNTPPQNDSPDGSDSSEAHTAEHGLAANAWVSRATTPAEQ